MGQLCMYHQRYMPSHETVFYVPPVVHAGGNVLKSHGIVVKYLPPNTTAILQPMDQGILQNVKMNYKRSFLSRFLEELDSKQNFSLALKEINLNNVIYMAANSWDKIKSETIMKSRKKLLPKITIELAEIEENSTVRHECEDMLRNVRECRDINENEIEHWFTCDDNSTRQYMDDNELMSLCLQEDKENEEMETQEGTEENETNNCVSISLRQAINLCSDLIDYLDSQKETASSQMFSRK
ncbi:PREDICTED: tigger transposable element-derived protein 2-like [Habropoda laboriosa]|uniref:tigger transposable element-derived protein 2-like n=1 Tax=Habropoda laboriosa TaxID=597456 RepID=UPI00083DE976|nr:PREDICTED: tigger transposable element-derived protein 2-like [Habropoda laboriosa]